MIKSFYVFAVLLQVYVNGVKHSTFKHRLPVEKFSNLGIGGDVSMNMLGYIDVSKAGSFSLCVFCFIIRFLISFFIQEND